MDINFLKKTLKSFPIDIFLLLAYHKYDTNRDINDIDSSPDTKEALKKGVHIMMDKENAADLLTLVDDDGQEHEFQIADTLDLDDERYVALVASYDDPDEQLNDDGELIILKSVFEGNDEFLQAIEDEKEFDKVAAIFMNRLEEYYDFVDDSDGEDAK